MSEHNPTPDSVTMHPEQIEGYDYGTDQAAISPLTIEELERLKAVAGLTEDDEAALIDEFAIRIDHRLDRTLGQTLHLAINHLHGPVHDALLDRLLEDEVERLGEGGEQLLREARWQLEVHQVADLDRFCGAFVGHLTS